MSQNTPDKNEAAEERTEDTKRFVRQVRAATRRKYTSGEKIRIVLEGFRRESRMMPPHNVWSRALLCSRRQCGSCSAWTRWRRS